MRDARKLIDDGVHTMGPRVFSILLAMLAVVAVFNYIPFVSRYALWVLLAAYIMSLAGA